MGELFNDNYDDDDDENSFSISRVQAETGFAKDEDGNLILKARTGGGEPRPSSAASSSVSDMIAASERRHPSAALPPPVRLQSAFQPGASPRHFTSRFMAYNSVGIVKAFTSESESSIDVEFHDVAVHHAFHLANPDGYGLAALTGRLLLLAREGDGEETAAKICVNYFASSDINKEWSLELAMGETVVAVAGTVKLLSHCQIFKLNFFLLF
jgi:chromosome transmission fidelity protein 4